MRLTTRPYWVFPLIPNPIVRYEIDELKTLYVYNTLKGECETIPLEGLTVDTQRGSWVSFLINRIFGSGNIELKGSAVNGSKIILNIRNIEEFITAISGSHPDIQLKKKDNNWMRSFREQDLSKYEVFYPHIPEVVYKLLCEIKGINTTQLIFNFQVEVGDLVSKGDKIATFGEHSVTAPNNGKITFLGSSRPTQHEWSVRNEPLHSTTTKESNLEITTGEIQCPEGILPEEYYLFGMRFREADKESNLDIHKYRPRHSLNQVFDWGKIWLVRPKGILRRFFNIGTIYSFSSKVDLAVGELKGVSSGFLPRKLKSDNEFRVKMIPYWSHLCNSSGSIIYTKS